MQSLLTAIYPILKENYGLDFVQIGLLTFTFQVTASLLQPAIGMFTDKRPLPYSLPVGMGSTPGRPHRPRLCAELLGCCCSARRWSASARRSSIPRARGWRGSRRAAGTGWRRRCSRWAAMSGSAIGPLLAAFIVLPRGQSERQLVRGRLARRHLHPVAGRATGTPRTAAPMPGKAPVSTALPFDRRDDADRARRARRC